MAPVLNRFRPNNFQPRRKVLNFVNKSNKQTQVKRLQPIFYEPNNTKVIQPNVQVSEPIKEAVEPIVEPVARELSKPIEPRRSKRVRTILASRPAQEALSAQEPPARRHQPPRNTLAGFPPVQPPPEAVPLGQGRPGQTSARHRRRSLLLVPGRPPRHR